MVQKSLTDVLG